LKSKKREILSEYEKMLELYFLDYEFLSSKIINCSTVENIDKSARERKASDFLESAEKR